jgi:hypothetical protein
MNDSSEIPAGWGLWYHGTAEAFDEFDDNHIGKGGDCNTGLGHFLALAPCGAVQYVEYQRDRGGRADVLIVAAAEHNSYAASSSEFWCENEGSSKDDIDPMGNVTVPGGTRTRQRLLSEGYTSLVIDDIDGTGAVMAMFEARNLRILARISVLAAERMEEWMDENSLGAPPNNERWDKMKQWLDQDAKAPRPTLAELLQRARTRAYKEAPACLM